MILVEPEEVEVAFHDNGRRVGGDISWRVTVDVGGDVEVNHCQDACVVTDGVGGCGVTVCVI